MSTVKSTSQPTSQRNPTCSDYHSFLEGLYKGYADCSKWCREQCSMENLSPSQIDRMLETCKKECKAWQHRSPAGQ